MAPNAQNAKLVFVNAPTRNSEKSRSFYQALLGTEFAHGLNPNVPSWWTPLEPGIDFNITARYDDRERLTPYFAVENLDIAIKQLEERGGRCVVAPRDVILGPDEGRRFYIAEQEKQGHKVGLEDAKTVGRMAVILDPDLNHVGLMQVAPHAHDHFLLTGRRRGQFGEQQVGAFSKMKDLADRLESAGALPKI